MTTTIDRQTTYKSAATQSDDTWVIIERARNKPSDLDGLCYSDDSSWHFLVFAACICWEELNDGGGHEGDRSSEQEKWWTRLAMTNWDLITSYDEKHHLKVQVRVRWIWGWLKSDLVKMSKTPAISKRIVTGFGWLVEFHRHNHEIRYYGKWKLLGRISWPWPSQKSVVSGTPRGHIGAVQLVLHQIRWTE